MFIASREDSEFAQSIEKAELLVPDGIGLVWLLKRLGISHVQRIAGIDLAWDILKTASKTNLSIALWGAEQSTLDKVTSKLYTDLNAKIVFACDGYQEDTQEIMEQLLDLQPSVLLIAMNFCKQEKFLEQLHQRGLKSVMLGVGGSFDVWAGSVRRAPSLWQNLNLEWLWRLCQQPQRLSRLTQLFMKFFPIYLHKDAPELSIR